MAQWMVNEFKGRNIFLLSRGGGNTGFIASSLVRRTQLRSKDAPESYPSVTLGNIALRLWESSPTAIC
jgi:hypothetical protein